MNVELAPPRARRTQAQRREESERRLLEAAAEIIAAEGYLACTLERVGTAAGFSRGLASRKYGSKDGLIEAVIWHVSAHVHEQIDIAIADKADPLDQLLALFDRFVELVVSDPAVRAYFVLFSAMIANRLETRSVFDEVQVRFGQRLHELIAAAQAAGSIPARVPAQHAAFMVGCLLAGISVETVIEFARDADPAQLRADLVAMLRGALLG
ncbi:TetR/AcrR family transcriptional regulator [Novosphingobium sp.]|uniref:TetR/AcrR family transcriptional regulator n=1 Tax=Novosphingobium sp. TaxID=1874826 RepID=UPI001EB121FE|nr:TetR/AcrR family transcriptional regulator [Novosphingobium sp.]MBK6801610.1 TetR family transcriptional regulator [Novosphingobium sp.]MBK9010490.1 TetR family transcriptional regulator [Novosphingobium sp.]